MDIIMTTELIIREACKADAGDICLLNGNSLGYDFPADRTKERLHVILAAVRDKLYVALFRR